MNEIILIGSGGHARACIDVIELADRFTIAGLIEKPGSSSRGNLGHTIIGTDSDLVKLRQKYNIALVTVGQIKSAQSRIRLFKILQGLDFSLPVVISPMAYVSKHATIGAGTIIMHGAIVNANAVIGKNCIINNRVLIEHDVIVGDHCHIATGSIVNGSVSVGDETFVGSGTILKQSISIGKNCVLGAGLFIKTSYQSNQWVK
jgi:sugar O-acyltransferase (sialic acid O-acetyltransferase NeuD family)